MEHIYGENDFVPQQNVLLILPQQTSIVVVSIPIVPTITQIVTITITVLTGTSETFTTTILVCWGCINKTFC